MSTAAHLRKRIRQAAAQAEIPIQRIYLHRGRVHVRTPQGECSTALTQAQQDPRGALPAG